MLEMFLKHLKRKGMAVWPLIAKFVMDRRNFMLAALILSLVRSLKLKCYGTISYITQIILSDANFNP